VVAGLLLVSTSTLPQKTLVLVVDLCAKKESQDFNFILYLHVLEKLLYSMIFDIHNLEIHSIKVAEMKSHERMVEFIKL
jgi:hypothetical protein